MMALLNNTVERPLSGHPGLHADIAGMSSQHWVPLPNVVIRAKTNSCSKTRILSLNISPKHGYSTSLASKSTYYIDQVRTNYGKFHIHFSGPSVWNSLDENLKSSSLHLFKETMKADLLHLLLMLAACMPVTLINVNFMILWYRFVSVCLFAFLFYVVLQYFMLF